MPVGFPGCKGGSSLNYLIRNAMSCDLPAVSDASLWRSSPSLDTGAKASGGFPVPYPHSLQQATKVLDMTATSVVIFRMTLGSQLRPPASLLPTSNARPCVIRSVIQTQIVPLFSTAYNIPFQQLLSFDIDTTLPRGGYEWAGPILHSCKACPCAPFVQIVPLFSTAYKLPFC